MVSKYNCQTYVHPYILKGEQTDHYYREVDQIYLLHSCDI